LPPGYFFLEVLPALESVTMSETISKISSRSRMAL
jgi:hypothetical protein